MTDWQRLPDRTTEDGQTLITEKAEIDGVTWYHGNIPAPLVPDKPYWKRTLWRRIRYSFSKYPPLGPPA